MLALLELELFEFDQHDELAAKRELAAKHDEFAAKHDDEKAIDIIRVVTACC